MKKKFCFGIITALLIAGVILASCSNLIEDLNRKKSWLKTEPDGTVLFGMWPQTIKAADVTVDESVYKVVGGFTYFQGDDGEWYVKVLSPTQNNTLLNGLRFSDGSYILKGRIYFFKVEPIRWRIISNNYGGKKLLLAENILINCKYYDDMNNRGTIYPNNYKESRIRAYLNGIPYNKKGSISNEFVEKGFLQTAFTPEEQLKIAVTTVDNSPDSASDAQGNIPKATDYACENTNDQIFLLSEREITMQKYGFSAYDVYIGDSHGTTSSNRIRQTTDLSKVLNCQRSLTKGYGGWAVLRSPFPPYDKDTNSNIYGYVCDIYHDGNPYYETPLSVNDAKTGVCPALCIID